MFRTKGKAANKKHLETLLRISLILQNLGWPQVSKAIKQNYFREERMLAKALKQMRFFENGVKHEDIKASIKRLQKGCDYMKKKDRYTGHRYAKPNRSSENDIYSNSDRYARTTGNKKYKKRKKKWSAKKKIIVTLCIILGIILMIAGIVFAYILSLIHI